MRRLASVAVGLGLCCVSLIACGRLGFDTLSDEQIAILGDASAPPGDGTDPSNVGDTGGSGTQNSDGSSGSTANSGGSSGSTSSNGGSGGTQNNSAGAGTTGTAGSSGTPDAGPGNSPPTAVLALSRTLGDTADSFSMDADGSLDIEDPFGDLTFEWDFENDGTFDATGDTVTHTFASPGSYTIRLQVMDTGGLTDTTTKGVEVLATGDLFWVTTYLDESDAEQIGSPALGDGLSLREAVALAEGQTGHHETIAIDASVTQPLLLGSALSNSDADGFTVLGNGAAIDGSGVGGIGNCWIISGGQVTIDSVELYGCSGRPLWFDGGADHQLTNSSLHDNGNGLLVSSGVTGVVIGPGNEFYNFSSSTMLLNAAVDVIGNTIHDVDEGFVLSGSSDGSRVLQNLFYGLSRALNISAGGNNLDIFHNTIVGATSDGVVVGSVSGIRFENNAITDSTGTGLVGGSAGFSARGYNLFWNNGSGDCSPCTVASTSLQKDPKYENAAGDDYRPSATSPLVDSGTDTGLDVNGSAAAKFNGSAPDIGYSEL